MNSHFEIGRAGEIVTRPKTKAAKGLSFALCAVLSILIWPLFLTAQDNASVTGKVQGTDGAALAGVKVTLVNQETQAKEETIAAEDGTFVFTQLAQGNYLLQVEGSGFEPYQSPIKVGTERPSSLRIKLKLRTVEEEVTVRPDTSDDRVSPESNRYSMKIDDHGHPNRENQSQSLFCGVSTSRRCKSGNHHKTRTPPSVLWQRRIFREEFRFRRAKRLCSYEAGAEPAVCGGRLERAAAWEEWQLFCRRRAFDGR